VYNIANSELQGEKLRLRKRTLVVMRNAAYQELFIPSFSNLTSYARRMCARINFSSIATRNRISVECGPNYWDVIRTVNDLLAKCYIAIGNEAMH
jgi:hypothetical protein